MLREYLKILSAIVLTLFTLATLLALVTGLLALLAEEDIAERITLPYIIAIMGFVLFGISGSVLWLLFLRILGRQPASLMRRHTLAVCLAASTNWLAFTFIFGGGVTQIGDTAPLLVFLFPVAASSLLCYRLLFIRPIPTGNYKRYGGKKQV